MAVTLYTDRRMIEHRVPGRHPERPERLTAILRHLERTGYLNSCPSGCVREAVNEELLRVHESGYLHELEQLEARGAELLIWTHGFIPNRSWRLGWRPARPSRRSRTWSAAAISGHYA